MEKKTQDFSAQEARRLAATPEGQKLMALLRQSDSAQLQKAREAASAGRYAEVGNLLQSLLSSPEARQLMEQLGKRHG